MSKCGIGRVVVNSSQQTVNTSARVSKLRICYPIYLSTITPTQNIPFTNYKSSQRPHNLKIYAFVQPSSSTPPNQHPAPFRFTVSSTHPSRPHKTRPDDRHPRPRCDPAGSERARTVEPVSCLRKLGVFVRENLSGGSGHDLIWAVDGSTSCHVCHVASRCLVAGLGWLVKSMLLTLVGCALVDGLR